MGSLFHDGDIEDYIEEFKTLSALILGQSEKQAIGMFPRGLQTDVRNGVWALNPDSCNKAMDYACHVCVATTAHTDFNSRGRSPAVLLMAPLQLWPKPNLLYPLARPFPFINTCRLIENEWDCGLCFSCGQVYSS